MGSTGAYVLDVYCDGDGCAAKDPCERAYSQGIGRNLREAKRELREAGWKISKRVPARGETLAPSPGALCPHCAKGGNHG